MFPELKITLADSLNKRLLFLNEVMEALNLKDIETVHGRAEELSKRKDYRESFDLCVSRAVANLSTLSEHLSTQAANLSLISLVRWTMS